ncbi:RagB/SusD family nutrient uptake outer membrane protein [Mediterranea massiliensis]|uniref:RagB/SusD family nutrient uptake outer membrane protein n=1 Tax=Mediterranea massiliensis TaxID=1841865 RepID=UPI000934677F|nr:RagB/SusD family nutrient uptake outer membrane protein [Mediterranea massiliensis]
MKLKNIFLNTMALVGGLLATSSCNDFLDMKPLDQVTPGEYFSTADQVGAYCISQYNGLFSTHSGFGAGTVNNDKNTDNMVAGGYSSAYFEKGQWRVPNTGGWDFSQIRYCNYFFETVIPKYEAGLITGGDDVIRHYIGEMYFIRAWVYYSKLKTFGDFPIVTKVLPDVKDELIAHSARRPRNEVARFIISQLDSAAMYMQEDISGNKTRLTRDCALLVKSRVALYEATFEKYHRGTGRVPGDANWPGKKVYPNYSTDIDQEINWFLDQAMAAAEQVADKIQLTENTGLTNPTGPSAITNWNPYFEMFAAEDMSVYPEVLFWKDYLISGDVAISHGTPAYIYSGGNNGMLKSFVDCFVMEDGLPYYKSNDYKGDKRIMDVKANRDLRLQLFLFGEDDMLPSKNTEDGTFKAFAQPNVISTEAQTIDQTGYRIRKCLTYDKNQIVSGQSSSTTGCIIFRAVEAYLNYLEAYYVKNGKVDGKAAQYWKAVRTRAGINPDYTNSINNTDLAQETDLAAHPGGYEVDATLYNIRRERRCEFIGEGMRWDDLIRWRAWDALLTTKFIPEGYNFWDEAYKTYELPEGTDEINDDPNSPTANMSSRLVSKYVRPFAKVKANNAVYDGFTWAKANYLSPIAVNEIKLASPDNSVDNSVIYQNPYWPTEIDGTAIE